MRPPLQDLGTCLRTSPRAYFSSSSSPFCFFLAVLSGFSSDSDESSFFEAFLPQPAAAIDRPPARSTHRDHRSVMALDATRAGGASPSRALVGTEHEPPMPAKLSSGTEE